MMIRDACSLHLLSKFVSLRQEAMFKHFKHLLFSLSILFMLLPLVSSQPSVIWDNYDLTPDNEAFQGGVSYFTYGSNITNRTYTACGIVDDSLITTNFQPLAVDLNADNDVEIVIPCGNYLRILNSNLILEDEYITGLSRGQLASVYMPDGTFDIVGIFNVSGAWTYERISWDGAVWSIEQNFTISSGLSNGSIWIKCPYETWNNSYLCMYYDYNMVLHGFNTSATSESDDKVGYDFGTETLYSYGTRMFGMGHLDTDADKEICVVFKVAQSNSLVKCIDESKNLIINYNITDRVDCNELQFYEPIFTDIQTGGFKDLIIVLTSTQASQCDSNSDYWKTKVYRIQYDGASGTIPIGYSVPTESGSCYTSSFHYHPRAVSFPLIYDIDGNGYRDIGMRMYYAEGLASSCPAMNKMAWYDGINGSKIFNYDHLANATFLYDSELGWVNHIYENSYSQEAFVDRYGVSYMNGTRIYAFRNVPYNPITADIDFDGANDFLFSSGTTTYGFFSRINNALPTITNVAVGSYVVQINQSTSFVVTATDPELDTKLYSFDCGNGSFSSFGISNSKTCYFYSLGEKVVRIKVTDDIHTEAQYVSWNGTITIQEEAVTPIPDIIGGEAGSVAINTELVNIDDMESGLLPNIYEGLINFFSVTLVPLVIIIIAILIIALASLVYKKARSF